MNFSRRIKRSTRLQAALILFVFTASQPTSAAPFILADGIRPAPLTPIPFEIPQSFGWVKETHGDFSEKSPTIYYIEDAHANYKAQLKIKELLRWLGEEKGVDLLLLEGSGAKFNPDRFRFFEQESLNRLLADGLAKKGFVTGAELFLLEAGKNVHALGIEAPALYVENLKTFRRVMAETKKQEETFRELTSALERLELRLLNSDLKNFLRDKRRYEDDALPITSFIPTLRRTAAKHLDLDFLSPETQIDWPQLVRLAHLEESGRALDLAAVKKEAAVLSVDLTKRGISEDLLATFRALCDSKSAAPAEGVRLFLERLYVAALPEGLAIEKYPNLRQKLALLIFQEELEPDTLRREMEALTDRLMTALAKTDAERTVLRLGRDIYVIRQGSRLALDGDLLREFRARREYVTPAAFAKTIEDLGEQVQIPSNAREFGILLTDIESFYRGAEARDRFFATRIFEALKGERRKKAVLITGGFHSRPLTDMLREKGASFALLTPKIGLADKSRSLYYEVMTGEKAGKPAGRSNILLHPPMASDWRTLSEASGQPTSLTDQTMDIIRMGAVQGRVSGNALKSFNPRSAAGESFLDSRLIARGFGAEDPAAQKLPGEAEWRALLDTPLMGLGSSLNERYGVGLGSSLSERYADRLSYQIDEGGKRVSVTVRVDWIASSALPISDIKGEQEASTALHALASMLQELYPLYDGGKLGRADFPEDGFSNIFITFHSATHSSRSFAAEASRRASRAGVNYRPDGAYRLGDPKLEPPTSGFGAKVKILLADEFADPQTRLRILQLTHRTFNDRAVLIKDKFEQKDKAERLRAIRAAIEREKPAVVILRSATKAFNDAEFVRFAKANGVRSIVRAGVGVDNVNIPAATKEGISLALTRGSANSVANVAVRLLLRAMMSRAGWYGSNDDRAIDIADSDSKYKRVLDISPNELRALAVKSSKAPVGYMTDSRAAGIFPAITPGTLEKLLLDFHGKTIGILGYGPIAQAVVEKLDELQSFSGARFDILAVTRNRHKYTAHAYTHKVRFAISPEEVFSKSAFITLHLPEGVVIKPSDIPNDSPLEAVINTSRQGLVDESFIQVLLDRDIQYFGDLDVDDKMATLYEEQRGSAFVIPHIGASTEDAAAGVEKNTLAALGYIIPTLLGEEPPADSAPEFVNDVKLEPLTGFGVRDAVNPEAFIDDLVRVARILGVDETQDARVLETLVQSIDPITFVHELRSLLGVKGSKESADIEKVLAALEGTARFKPLAAEYRGAAHPISHVHVLKAKRERAGDVPFPFRDEMEFYTKRFLGRGEASALTIKPDLEGTLSRIDEQFLSRIYLNNIRYVITSGIGANEMYSHQLARVVNQWLQPKGVQWIVVNNDADVSRLPAGANSENTIVFEMSRSGTTAETLGFFKATRDRFKRRVVAANPSEKPESLYQLSKKLAEDSQAIILNIDDIPGHIGGRQMNRATIMTYGPLYLALIVGAEQADSAKDLLRAYVDSLMQATVQFDYRKENSPNQAIELAEHLYRHGRGAGRFKWSVIYDPALEGTAKELLQLVNEGANKERNLNILDAYRHDDKATYGRIFDADPSHQLPIFLLNELAVADSARTDREIERLKQRGMPVMVLKVKVTSETDPEGLAFNLKHLAYATALIQDAIVYFTYLTNQDANSNPAVKLVREITGVNFEIVRENAAKGSGYSIKLRDVTRMLAEHRKREEARAARTVADKLAHTMEPAATESFNPLLDNLQPLADSLDVSVRDATGALVRSVRRNKFMSDVGEFGGSSIAMIDEAFGRASFSSTLGKAVKKLRRPSPLSRQILLNSEASRRVSVVVGKNDAARKFMKRPLDDSLAVNLGDYLFQMYQSGRGENLKYLPVVHMEADHVHPAIKAMQDKVEELFADRGITSPRWVSLPGAAHTGIEALMSHPENVFTISIVSTHARGDATDQASYVYGIGNVLRMALGGSPSVIFEIKNSDQLNEVKGIVTAALERFRTRVDEYETSRGFGADQESVIKDGTSFVSERAAEPIGNYPHARRSGNFVYLSGIGPRKKGEKITRDGMTRDERGVVIPFDITVQAHRAFENVRLILEDAGIPWENIVDVQVFLTNMEDQPVFEKVWAEYFPVGSKNLPTRTTTQSPNLPTPIAVELKVIAEVKRGFGIAAPDNAELLKNARRLGPTRPDLENVFKRQVEAKTDEYIKKNRLFDIENNKGEVTVTLKREHLHPYDAAANPEGLGLLKWLTEYEKEAKIATAGIRLTQNVLYPWDTRNRISEVGIAFATLAKALVSNELFPGSRLEKMAGGEVRYNTKHYVELIARIQAAQGIRTFLPAGRESIPIWMLCFLIFMNDFLGGEEVTSSHANSSFSATKDLNNQGSQYLPEESMKFVAKIREMFEKAERDGQFTFKIAANNDPLIDTEFMRSINDGVKLYADYLRKGVATDVNINQIKNARRKIVIENVGGSMHRMMPRIFRELGIENHFEWFRPEEDPFFHGIGKDVEPNGEFKDYTQDTTIINRNKKTGEITSIPVMERMGYDTLLKDKEIGTTILMTDPDGDRLVTAQIEPASRATFLREAGIDFLVLDEKRIVALYTPNQSFLMTMVHHAEALKTAGKWDEHPRFIIMTTASSAAWREWAEKNDVNVVMVPVGFKEIAAVMKKIEAQMAANPNREVSVRDAMGRTINLGVQPRLLFAGEESGGMIIGPDEPVQSKGGRIAIAMREKSAGEALVIQAAMAARFESEGRYFSDYLADIFRTNDIKGRFDVRHDKTFYNQSNPDPVALAAEKIRGEGLRTKNYLFYLSMALAYGEGRLAREQVIAILDNTFLAEGLTFSDLKQIYFVGDGVFFEFPSKVLEIRPSGTDAKSKSYAMGDDKMTLARYAQALGEYSGEITALHREFVPEEYVSGGMDKAWAMYDAYYRDGLPEDTYAPAVKIPELSLIDAIILESISQATQKPIEAGWLNQTYAALGLASAAKVGIGNKIAGRLNEILSEKWSKSWYRPQTFLNAGRILQHLSVQETREWATQAFDAEQNRINKALGFGAQSPQQKYNVLTLDGLKDVPLRTNLVLDSRYFFTIKDLRRFGAASDLAHMYGDQLTFWTSTPRDPRKVSVRITVNGSPGSDDVLFANLWLRAFLDKLTSGYMYPQYKATRRPVVRGLAGKKTSVTLYLSRPPRKTGFGNANAVDVAAVVIKHVARVSGRSPTEISLDTRYANLKLKPGSQWEIGREILSDLNVHLRQIRGERRYSSTPLPEAAVLATTTPHHQSLRDTYTWAKGIFDAEIEKIDRAGKPRGFGANEDKSFEETRGYLAFREMIEGTESILQNGSDAYELIPLSDKQIQAQWLALTERQRAEWERSGFGSTKEDAETPGYRMYFDATEALGENPIVRNGTRVFQPPTASEIRAQWDALTPEARASWEKKAADFAGRGFGVTDTVFNIPGINNQFTATPKVVEAFTARSHTAPVTALQAGFGVTVQLAGYVLPGEFDLELRAEALRTVQPEEGITPDQIARVTNLLNTLSVEEILNASITNAQVKAELKKAMNYTQGVALVVTPDGHTVESASRLKGTVTTKDTLVIPAGDAVEDKRSVVKALRGLLDIAARPVFHLPRRVTNAELKALADSLGAAALGGVIGENTEAVDNLSARPFVQFTEDQNTGSLQTGDAFKHLLRYALDEFMHLDTVAYGQGSEALRRQIQETLGFTIDTEGRVRVTSISSLARALDRLALDRQIQRQVAQAA